MTLVDAIANVRLRMERACIDAKRDPGDLTLIAVTKTVPVPRIQEAVSYTHLTLPTNREV